LSARKAATSRNKVRYWRDKRGLTQPGLAAKAGCSVTLLSDIERGNRKLNEDVRDRLAQALDISVLQLFGHTEPIIRVTAMPADTNPYGGVFGGWLMGQMGLACGSFASRRTHGKAILVAADAIKFPGAMAVGDELSVYVDLMKQGRTSLRVKAEAIARQRDGDIETLVAQGEFTFVALDEAGKPREIAHD
jgi:acyl-CoA thioesterase YciA